MNFRNALLIADVSWRFWVIRVLLIFVEAPSLAKVFCALPFLRYSQLTYESKCVVFNWSLRWSSRCGHSTCLPSSLLLFWMDRSSSFHIGVAKEMDRFEAHAWVESGAQTFTTIETSSLTRIWDFDGL